MKRTKKEREEGCRKSREMCSKENKARRKEIGQFCCHELGFGNISDISSEPEMPALNSTYI
jgi:hypothetical protein